MTTTTRDVVTLPAAIVIAGVYGLQVRMRHGHYWNGKTIRMDEGGLPKQQRPRTGSNILHDVAHYVVCPRSRRGLPDFGLGSSDTPLQGGSGHTYLRGAKRITRYRRADEEETWASCLGICMELWAGADAYFTMQEHNWDDDRSHSKFLQIAGYLVRRRLLTPEGIPWQLRNTPSLSTSLQPSANSSDDT